MSDVSIYIYALCEPNDSRTVRYIGKTSDLSGRYRAHLRYAHKQSTHKDRWLIRLLERGVSPVMEVLEICTSDTWTDAERTWIAFYRAQTDVLTNIADGGEGGLSTATKLEGVRFGLLTALRQTTKDKKNQWRWLCRCDCGAEKEVTSVYLLNGDTRSCGSKHKVPYNSLDLTGQVFGRLTVLRDTGRTPNKHRLWECVCQCGNTTVVRSGCLRRGNTSSCGCLRRECARARLARQHEKQRAQALVRKVAVSA